MFDKLIRQAEQVSSDLGHSRRRFLGRAGRGALATACALGTLLAAPTRAQAGPGRSCRPCYNECIKHCGSDPTCDYECFYACCLIF
jgi:hypothetical protein